MVDNTQLNHLLEKYKAGNCTEKEISLLYKWLDMLEANSENSVSHELNLEEIKHQTFVGLLRQKSVEKQSKPMWLISSIAAVTALFCVGLVLLLILRDKSTVRQSVVWVSETAKNGEIRKITLPDSSVVWLYAGTMLKYPMPFDKIERRVVMEKGMAFFEVRHDEKCPFTVTTSRIKTTVLGTSFNIRAYPKESAIQVAVVTGKVKVTDEKQELAVLKPCQQLTVHKVNSLYTVENVIPEQKKLWIEGEIIFKNATIKEMLKTLGEFYGVDFKPHLDTQQGRYNFQIDQKKTLKQVLDIIQTISYQPRLKFEEKNKIIHVYEVK
jgi:ferric-dicitrate binding protein FerR (iron transport regulator)